METIREGDLLFSLPSTFYSRVTVLVGKQILYDQTSDPAHAVPTSHPPSGLSDNSASGVKSRVEPNEPLATVQWKQTSQSGEANITW